MEATFFQKGERRGARKNGARVASFPRLPRLRVRLRGGIVARADSYAQRSRRVNAHVSGEA